MFHVKHGDVEHGDVEQGSTVHSALSVPSAGGARDHPAA